MISVSDAWIAAHKETLLPESFIEITYTATEPGLQYAAQVTSTPETPYSNVEDVVKDSVKNHDKYATLEHGLWGLDGSFVYRSDKNVNSGFIGEALSSGDGSFSTVPKLTVNFSGQRIIPIPGITIDWGVAYGEWAVDFRIIAYLGSDSVVSHTVTGNKSSTSVVWLELVGYDRITIEILRWSHPYHRARCCKLVLGIRTIYSKNDLMGYEHNQDVDLLSAALPKNEIKFRLRNDKDSWNPDNPVGSEQYLVEQQELSVRYGLSLSDGVEWIKGGTFWLSEWTTPTNGLESTFVARDAIVFMGAEYTGPRSGSLYDIAAAAFEQANIPTLIDGTVRYRIDSILRGYDTDFTDDTQAYTIAQILQMVAHAGCCVFYQDRDGIVWIKSWSPTYSGYMIEPFVSYSHPEYTISKPLKAVSVGYPDNRAVIPVSDHGETQTVDNTLINTETAARRVGLKVKDILENRKVISGDYRADIRLDALDPIIVRSKYATNLIAVTNIKYSTTGGAVRGKYTGRVISLTLDGEDRRSGEFYVGELIE